MASVINTNTLSMVTQQNLNQSQNALNTSMERLSSGLRINSAKDDAAGQAIANRMDSQITGLGQAQRNANDGISLAQTAEGALNQVNDNLQRVRELTVQAQNGTNSASDIDSIQQEVNLRLEEIDRISRETDFNGNKILSGDALSTINIQVGSDDGQTIGIEIEANTPWNMYNSTGTPTTTLATVNGETRSIEPKGFDVLSATAPTTANASGVSALSANDFTEIDSTIDNVVSYTDTNGDVAYAAIGDDSGGSKVAYSVTFDASGAVSATGTSKLTGADATAATTSTDTITDSDEVQTTTITTNTTTTPAVKASGISALSAADFTDIDSTIDNIVSYADTNGDVAYAAIGDDSSGSKVAYSVTFDESGAVSASGTSKLAGTDATSAIASADTIADGDELIAAITTTTAGTSSTGSGPLADLDAALKAVDSQRSNLGAVQNRFDSAITNLATTETNLASAQSRIQDADYAEEVSSMTTAQILQQAGTSMLTQANQVPQNVLSLLG